MREKSVGGKNYDPVLESASRKALEEFLMPARHARSIALTPELDQWVEDLVQSGEYKSASEVLRDGLRALHDRREKFRAELAEIRARIGKSLDQADRKEYADGTGEEAIRRAFASALETATQ